MEHYDIKKDNCAECSSKDLFIKNKQHEYQLGADDDPDKVIMKVVIPVIHCKSCGFAWYNYLAEDIMARAEEPFRDAMHGKKNISKDVRS